ncbi:hypothetical protein LSUE1_G006395 [Lachnellula suecica]|uniref:Carbonic anhydrase n=1 Tax=Lachnellula suecica TaxID=602035 RepID=A0A8T9BYH3_9HELO|nr:hypothetical protein LSUE1_G006395 [Lachnellula suecica]
MFPGVWGKGGAWLLMGFGCREWARAEGYRAPVKFEEMQRMGREREDGTVIVGAFLLYGMDGISELRERHSGMYGSESDAGRVLRVHSALNTLLVLSAVGNAGKKGVIIVVHHTDCGLQSISDDEIKAILMKDIESESEMRDIVDMKFGSITDPEESVKEDVKTLKDNSFFKGMQIVGLVQDTETGLLKEVV